ncbi:conserved hypothetical protein [Neospora caninum Liverpool]|uniref:Cupin domain-containing protein n=1 Tax=Neospora caninum (strain Liverpool) TaxID=572307 RepID=F0VLJ1_NEOCL|nr:conserved hypothetical protein [Neospora caninum Liverpool]CBZ54119.1 conserved hypothetical protein [Neospora caninum Liverpool]CEL68818.1 TPA: hypothetical protein BN1204_045520 [Neospora caninum Liverpool]|eukprot:XP_003884150.1 conserved hypothetical protein [Neospora caninum Liverpool]
MEGGGAGTTLSADSPVHAADAGEKTSGGDDPVQTPEKANVLAAGEGSEGAESGGRRELVENKGDTEGQKAVPPSSRNDVNDATGETKAFEEGEKRSPLQRAKAEENTPSLHKDLDREGSRERRERDEQKVLSEPPSNTIGDSTSVSLSFSSSPFPSTSSSSSSLSSSSFIPSSTDMPHARRSTLPCLPPAFPAGDEEPAGSAFKKVSSPPAFPDADFFSPSSSPFPVQGALARGRAGVHTPEATHRDRLGSSQERDAQPRVPAIPLFPGSASCADSTSAAVPDASPFAASALAAASPSPVACASMASREFPVLADREATPSTRPGGASASLPGVRTFQNSGRKAADGDSGDRRRDPRGEAPAVLGVSPDGEEIGTHGAREAGRRETVFPSDAGFDLDTVAQERRKGEEEREEEREAGESACVFPSQLPLGPDASLPAPRGDFARGWEPPPVAHGASRGRAGSGVCTADASRDQPFLGGPARDAAEPEASSLSRRKFVLSEAEWRTKMPANAPVPLPLLTAPQRSGMHARTDQATSDPAAPSTKRQTGDTGDTGDRGRAEGDTARRGGPLEREGEVGEKEDSTAVPGEKRERDGGVATHAGKDRQDDRDETPHRPAAASLASLSGARGGAGERGVDLFRSRSAPASREEEASFWAAQVDEERMCPSCEGTRAVSLSLPALGFAAWPLFTTATLASSLHVIASPSSASPAALPWKLHLSSSVFMFVLDGAGVLQVTEGETERDFPFQTRAALSVPPLTPYRVLASSPQPLLLVVCQAPPPDEADGSLSTSGVRTDAAPPSRGD